MNTISIAMCEVDNKKKILVVDDDATIRFLLKSLLRDYEVFTMEDGFDALAWLNMNMPDLIVMDMEMPTIDGRKLLKRIKSSYKHRHIPIVVMSATDNQIIQSSFYKLGASDFIIKPFMGCDFVSRIKEAMN